MLISMRLLDHRLSVSVFNSPYDFHADAMKNEHKLRTCGGMDQQDHTLLVSWRAWPRRGAVLGVCG
jgi:hypothetical protein